MKKIILLITFISFGINAQKINETNVEWMTLSQALEAQKVNPKPIFIDVYTTWCGPCKMLDQQTFNVSSVVAHLNKYYYPVKFNAEGNETINFKGKTFKNPGYNPANANSRNTRHQLVAELEIPGFPTMLIIDSKGNVKNKIVGFRPANELTSELINTLKN